MSFRWQRNGPVTTSTCTSCGTTFTSRDETGLLRDQRGHDLTVCIERQRAARVASMADMDETPTASTVYKWRQGKMVEQDEAAPSVTSKPPLSSPFATDERIT